MKLSNTEALTENIGMRDFHISLRIYLYAGGIFLQNKKTSFIHSQLLIIIQLAISLIIIISAFVIKAIGGDIHAAVGTWFFQNYSNSIFTDTANSPLPFTDSTSLTETSRFSEYSEVTQP